MCNQPPSKSINKIVMTELILLLIMINKQSIADWHTGINSQGFEKYADTFFGVMFVIAFAGVLIIAIYSDGNSHPDENVSLKAAGYFRIHDLPPHVSDPEISDTFSAYGISRVTKEEISYFLTGKFAQFFGLFIKDDVLALRMFNVSLFFVLVILFFKSEKVIKPLFLLLLISPQIWYIFSYVNSDALGFFVSILLINQLVNKKSLFRKFLFTNKATGFILGSVFMALLIVLQFYSKKNYWLFLVFVAFILFWELILARQSRMKLLKKYFILIGFVLLLLTPGFAYNLMLYGWEKDQAIKQHKEKEAQREFKISNVGEKFSYYGYKLKEKGFKYFDLFTREWNWHVKSFYSFVGLYGWMNIFSPVSYYAIMFLLYLLLFGFLILNGVYRQPLEVKLLLIAVLIFNVGFIFLSTLTSWINDFQAQGRYLFPVIGVFSYWLVKSGISSSNSYFKLLIAIISLCSLYSFVFVALAEVICPM